jgi:hypothetical protein
MAELMPAPFCPLQELADAYGSFGVMISRKTHEYISDAAYATLVRRCQLKARSNLNDNPTPEQMDRHVRNFFHWQILIFLAKNIP